MDEFIGVTGAAGSVGSALCRQLKEADYSVRGLLHTQNSPDRIQKYLDDMVTGSVTSQKDVRKLLDGVDAVVHCAGLLPDSISLGHHEFMNVNVKGALNVLECAFEMQIPKVIFLSTIGVLDHTEPVKRQDLFNYRTKYLDHYSHSKIEAEKEILRLARDRDIDVTIIRPSFIYGPSSLRLWSQLIETTKNEKMYILGSGKGYFPLIYDDDLAAYIIKVLKRPAIKKNLQVSVVSNPEDITTLELFSMIAQKYEVAAPKQVPSIVAYLAAQILEFFPKKLKKGRLNMLTKRRVREYSKGYDLSAVLADGEERFIPKTSVHEGLQKMIEAFEARKK